MYLLLFIYLYSIYSDEKHDFGKQKDQKATAN